jgi:hypothetical protein
MNPTRKGVLLDLTREQAWVAHAALLDNLERVLDADGDPECHLAVLDALEARDAAFEPAELQVLADALRTYLEDPPARDDGPGRAALARVLARTPERPHSGESGRCECC